MNCQYLFSGEKHFNMLPAENFTQSAIKRFSFCFYREWIICSSIITDNDQS